MRVNNASAPRGDRINPMDEISELSSLESRQFEDGGDKCSQYRRESVYIRLHIISRISGRLNLFHLEIFSTSPPPSFQLDFSRLVLLMCTRNLPSTILTTKVKCARINQPAKNTCYKYYFPVEKYRDVDLKFGKLSFHENFICDIIYELIIKTKIYEYN